MLEEDLEEAEEEEREDDEDPKRFDVDDEEE